MFAGRRQFLPAIFAGMFCWALSGMWLAILASRQSARTVEIRSGLEGATAIEIIGDRPACLIGAAIARAVLTGKASRHNLSLSGRQCYPIYSLSRRKPAPERFCIILTDLEKAELQRRIDMQSAEMLVSTLSETVANTG